MLLLFYFFFTFLLKIRYDEKQQDFQKLFCDSPDQLA